jgi:hypothetical protein
MASLGELMVIITGNADGLKAALAEGSESTEAFGGEMDAAGASATGFAAGTGEAEASATGMAAGMDDATASAGELEGGLGDAAVAGGAAAGGLKDTEAAATDAKAGMSDAATEAGGLGSALTSAGTLGAAGIGIATVAVAAFAIKSGETVDNAYSQMGKATGLQGTQLQSLETQWGNVYANVPASASTVATVIDKVNNSLGLQGDALGKATQDIIDYSIATGTDATSDTDSFTTGLTEANRGLQAMHEPLMTTAQLSDMSTVAFQKTGKGIQDWGPAFDKATASMTAMGMSIPQQVAALSAFSQAGIPARQLTSLLQGIGPAADKAGESQQAFWQHLLEDGKTGVYTQDELKLLGKNQDNFTAAVKSGTITNQAYISSLQNSGGAAEKAAESNETFGEALTELENKLTLAFAPLGTTILTILKNFIVALTPVISFIGLLAKGFAALPMPIQAGMLAIGLIAGGVAAAGLALKMFNINIGDIITSITKLKGAGLSDITNQLKEFVGLGGSGAAKGVEAEAESAVGSASSKRPCPIDPACFDKCTQNAKGTTSELENMQNKGQGFDNLLQDATGKTSNLGDVIGDASGETGELAAGAGDVGEGLAAAGEGGGILSGIMGALPGPLAGILGSVGGIGEGLLGGAGAAGGLTGGLGAAVAASGPLIPITGAVALGLGTMAATSGTFRGMLGGAATAAGGVMTQVQGIAGALMSGNFSQAGQLLQQGFQGAIDSLKNFDFGEWAAQMIQSIKESVGNIGGMILNGLSSLSNIADTIMNWLNGIDWNSVVDGLVKAITGLFGGGGGGGGKSATTSVSTGMNKSLVDGATQAAPTVLMKLVGALGGLAVALLSIFPKIAMALGQAILNYLVTLDWGSIANQLWSAIQGALGTLGTWVWGLLVQVPGLLWQGFTSALGTLGTWLWGLLTPIPGELWNAFVSAIGTFGTWLWGLLSPIPGELWNSVTTQNWGQIGQNILTGVVSIGGSVLSAITGQDWGQIGQNILNGITSLGGQMGSAISGAVTSALSGANITFTIPIINKTVSFNLAEGAYIAARSGGVLAVIGEGGEDEYVIPASKMGDPTAISGLPRLAGGALVTGSVGNTNVSNVMRLSAATPSTSAQQSGGDMHIHFDGPIHTVSVQEARQYAKIVGNEFDSYRRRKGQMRG